MWWSTLQEADRLGKQMEQLQSEVHTAAGRCIAADKARDSAEQAAADASAELAALRLEFQLLQAAQAKALAEAEDFEQRVAAAVAGMMAGSACYLYTALADSPSAYETPCCFALGCLKLE